MIQRPFHEEQEWVPSPGSTGAQHTLTDNKPERDRVAELREVVAQVTGRPTPPKPHMGFI